jgi:Na+/melibiose symporter-like transporter
MKEQNLKNHTRLVAGYHGLTGIAIVALLVGAIVNLVHSSHDNLYSASLIVLTAVIFGLLFWYIRSFALRAQDRAIRAEENFRYFALTGARLPAGIRMSQVIALRFAPDEELTSLVQRVTTENLSSRQIKEAIQNWKADHHRA